MKRGCRNSFSLLMAVLLVACASQPPGAVRNNEKPQAPISRMQAEGAAREVVMYALGLLDVGYQFGGANPEAGLDCSGMVKFIYKQAVGMDLPHNAAEIAKRARPVADNALQAGDLVFFNTLGYANSHIGIYLGDNRFIHAPSSRGKVKVESLETPYFAKRYLGGRTLLQG